MKRTMLFSRCSALGNPMDQLARQEFIGYEKIFSDPCACFSVTLLFQPQSQLEFSSDSRFLCRCQCFMALPAILPVTIMDRNGNTLILSRPYWRHGTGPVAIGGNVLISSGRG